LSIFPDDSLGQPHAFAINASVAGERESRPSSKWRATRGSKRQSATPVCSPYVIRLA